MVTKVEKEEKYEEEEEEVKEGSFHKESPSSSFPMGRARWEGGKSYQYFDELTLLTWEMTEGAPLELIVGQ